jgi:glycosyltransferase involved in cell wall biosynthesis
MAIQALTQNLQDPDVTVLIRSKNDAAYVKQWFADIKAQEYSGDIQVVLVDTESTDGTVEYAQEQGASVISLKQADFTYPFALNKGFEAARHPYVVTLVGHSTWTNRYTLKSLTYWSQREDFGGMYNGPLAGHESSIWERLFSMLLLPLLQEPKIKTSATRGTLGANCAIVKRDVWQELGGYDERYAGGGEDTDLARSMLAAGYSIIREPLCVMFHSHGLGFVDFSRQIWHWIRVGSTKPQAFDTAQIHSRRPDLRQKRH